MFRDNLMSASLSAKSPNPSLMAAGGNSGTAHLHNSEHGPFALVRASAASPSAASHGLIAPPRAETVIQASGPVSAEREVANFLQDVREVGPLG